MKQMSWIQLTLLLTGGALCLPLIFFGHHLAQTIGLTSTLLAIGVGNSILAGIGWVMADIGGRQKLSTAWFACKVFGSFGEKILPSAMAAVKIAWFAIQLHLMARVFNQEVSFFHCVTLGTTITLVGCTGIKGLTRIASLSMPLFAITLGYTLYHVSGHTAALQETGPIQLQGISLILAAGLSAASALPNFLRQARTLADARITALLLFLVIVPFVEATGVYLYIHESGKDFLQTILSPGSGILWSLWATSFILLAGWTTNNTNLFSAAVCLEPIMPRLDENVRIALAGLLGTCLAFLPIHSQVQKLLEYIGIPLACMAGLLTIVALEKNKTAPRTNLAILFAGSGFGWSAAFLKFSVTGSPILDTLIFTGICKGIEKIFINFEEVRA